MYKITIIEPTKPCTIHDVIERFSGDNLMKLKRLKKQIKDYFADKKVKVESIGIINLYKN